MHPPASPQSGRSWSAPHRPDETHEPKSPAATRISLAVDPSASLGFEPQPTANARSEKEKEARGMEYLLRAFGFIVRSSVGGCSRRNAEQREAPKGVPRGETITRRAGAVACVRLPGPATSENRGARSAIEGARSHIRLDPQVFDLLGGEHELGLLRLDL